MAALGSLFFSEIMEFPPCSLCWYQRIFLFPLAIILGLGLFPLDMGAVRYGLPLAVIGGCIALYHNLIQWGLVRVALVPCRKGVSCGEKYINLFGIFSIPLLSLMAFGLIIFLLILLKRRKQHEQ